ncbi:hydrogenase expression protein HupH [Rhodobacteraceae bacterium WD3A24]|nr:hydrogenase expression protein HupH [Rhodobacteraceae bacterium WD3A24]
MDEVLAAPGVIDAALGAQEQGAGAVVIDCMLDPGLDAAREAVQIPVIGCGEAAMRDAAARGDFSIVTVLQSQEPLFHTLAGRYGLAGRLASVRGIGVPVLALHDDPDAATAFTVRESLVATEHDGAKTVIFGCTGMLGFAPRVQEALGVSARVIDPLPHAVAFAAAAARRFDPVEQAAGGPPHRKRIAGFVGWPFLDAAFNSAGASS